MKLTGFFFFCLIAWDCFAECMIVAHRGASNRAPENTVESVNLAWELGADAVEIDLHLSQDGVLVVYHDDTTERIGGKRGLVKDQSYARLQQLDVGSHKGTEFKGAKIPRLEEILAVIPTGKFVLMELKAGNELIAPLGATLSATRLDPAQIKIIGFDIDLLKSAKTQFPHLDVYWLVEINPYTPYERWPEEIRKSVLAAKNAGMNGLCVAGNAVASPYFVSQAKAANLKFFIYTIDSGSKAKRFAEMGIDGIITNRPDYVREALTGRPPLNTGGKTKDPFTGR